MKNWGSVTVRNIYTAPRPVSIAKGVLAIMCTSCRKVTLRAYCSSMTMRLSKFTSDRPDTCQRPVMPGFT